MKTAFVTGIFGQDGAYLAKLLLEKDYTVYGLVRDNSTHTHSNLEYLGIAQKVRFVKGDMTNEESLSKIVESIQPDEIYNLAAQSFVGISWEKAAETAQINALGTLHLLTAIKKHCPKAKFYQASTSEMFGNSHINGLQDETTPFHPKSPYAISKLYAHWITQNFRESYGMFCASGILFNHESPIRGLEFVTRKISMGVAKIKLGLANEIRLGSLDAQRDWGFAGDYVEAMWLMLQQDEPSNYIVCTGETHSVRDFVQTAFNTVGIDNWEQYIKIDSKFARPSDVTILKGTNEATIRKLGWKPKVAFKELVQMMVDADIERLTQEVKASTK